MSKDHDGDDELLARVRSAHPLPAHLQDDESLWADIRSGVYAGLAAPVRRHRLRAIAAVAIGLAAAAAVAISWSFHARHRAPSVSTDLVVEEMLFDEEASELVGHLSNEDLQAIDHHFKPGT